MKLLFPMPHQVELPAMVQPWERAVTGADQRRLAELADRLGYDMLAAPEHFLIPQAHRELSGAHYFHGGAAQAYYAGVTQRIRINSCITLLPLQHPAVTAKALSTIDWLSSGRAVVTFGVGWLEEEFDLLGVPFHERGRIADEYIAAILELWTSDSPSFDGRYVSFRDVAFEPKPVQKPHLPVWFGGDSDPALKRAAKYGSGWWAAHTRPEEIAQRIEFIKSQPDYAGGRFDVAYGLRTSRVGKGHVAADPDAKIELSAEELVDELGRLADRGVTYSSVPIPPMPSIAAYEDFATWVIEEIKPKLPGD